ncbi:MAG: class I SAM-dependent methyltransferase [Planctomycetota bacterium]|jgi:predicted O-methyltransferase YrrM
MEANRVDGGNTIELLEAPWGPSGKSLSSLVTTLSGGRLVALTPRHTPTPRYGHGKPPHALLARQLDAKRETYRQRLGSIADLADYLARIPRDRPPKDEPCPYWRNGWLPALDAAALYGFVAGAAPRRYVEIGSGVSTLFARRAIRDHGLPTEITSIDPRPRAEVDAACDVVIRRPLEETSLSLFEELLPGDILFVDSSHQAFMNSDVTVVFLDILPRLRPGVIVHFHDVWLPYDYPHRWKHWYFNEHYLLAAVLLAAPQRYDVLLPCMFVSIQPTLRDVLAPLWDALGLVDCPTHGGSFWMQQA